jgi:hypothetical protein
VDPDRCWRAFLVLLALAVLCLWVLVTKVVAHSDGDMVYPAECCSNRDCAPVDRAEVAQPPAMANMLAPPAHAGLGQMLITTKHGSVIVPANFPRRASGDGRMHACILNGRLICLFLPPAH